MIKKEKANHPQKVEFCQLFPSAENEKTSLNFSCYWGDSTFCTMVERNKIKSKLYTYLPWVELRSDA